MVSKQNKRPPKETYTRTQEPVTTEIYNLSLEENAETVPLYYPLELECVRDQGSLNG
jgi:hypothetical protein